jgi:hypothetical protein
MRVESAFLFSEAADQSLITATADYQKQKLSTTLHAPNLRS